MSRARTPEMTSFQLETLADTRGPASLFATILKRARIRSEPRAHPTGSTSEPEVDRDRHDHGDRHAVQESRREPPLPDGIGRGIVEQRDPA